MTTLSDFVNSGASNQAQVDANTNAIKALSGRNKVINGHMIIAQRGVSFVSPVSGTYTLDRWSVAYTGTVVITISQENDCPVPYKFNSLKYLITTADAAIASGDSLAINHVVEGHNIRNIIDRTFTVSFWVKASKVGKYSVSFRNFDNSACYVTEYTIDQANTWEKKVITLIGGLPSAHNWNVSTGIGLKLQFGLSSGSTYFTPSLNNWVTGGNYTMSPNQINLSDTVGATFLLTGVQLELGEQATEFEITSVPDEINKCLRYYEIVTLSCGAPSTSTAGNIVASTAFKVHKRAVPTITFIQNDLYPPIGVAATSTYLPSTSGVASFRTCTVSGSHEYSERVSASAEL